MEKLLQTYLEKRFQSPVKVSGIKPLSGGACQDNYSIDLHWEKGEWEGERKTVLRRDKGGSLMASLSRKDEYAVSNLAYRHNVKTPRPLLLEESSGVLGSPFYLMERISGKANGRYLVKDPSLNKIRDSLGDELAYQLSLIHSIRPGDADIDLENVLWINGGNAEKGNDVALKSVESLRRELDKREERYPAMELILNWLEERAIPTEDPVLVHGDFRTGNFMVNESGLQGIMDWEFAHWGDFHEDLTWICLRDWRFGKVKNEAGGILPREKFYELYSQKSGRTIDKQLVTYWEVMGNLRWAIGCLGQAERHLSGKDKGIELASIGRRACEMEWEAMRLIENAG